MKNLFKFKERLASGVRRYGRVLSLIVTGLMLSSGAWADTYHLLVGTSEESCDSYTDKATGSNTFVFESSGWDVRMVLSSSNSCSGRINPSGKTFNKGSGVNTFEARNRGSYYFIYFKPTSNASKTYTLTYDGSKYTLAEGGSTTAPSIRIGKKAVVNGTNVTFNGQIADWGCANVTKVTVYYSTSGNPEESSSKKEITLSPAIGENTNTGNLNTTGWGSGTYTYALTATNGKGESELSDFGTFTVQACTPPTITTLPQVSPNQNIDYPKVISARYRISGGTCDITSAGVNVYLDASCTNKKYELTNSASGSTAKDTDIAFDVTLKENTIYYVKAFVTLDGGSTIESTDAQTYFTFPVLPTTTGAENTDCGKFVAKASTDLTSKEDGGTAKFSSYSVTFRVWDNDATVTGYGTPTSYYTKTASSVSGTEASATFNIASVTRYDDKTTKMQMGSTYKYIAYYTLSNVAFSDRDLTMFSRTYRDTYAPKSFTIPAPSCTNGTVPSFADVVLGQSGTAQNATFTYCGYDNFTYELSGANAGDFQLGSGTASNGTITLPVTFKPTSTGVGSKTANIIVKSNGTQVATMAISATALCITPTAADYNVTNNTYIYDGQSHTATITPRTDATYGKYPTGTAQYGGQASQTNVGNYTIHYNVSAGGNYCAANFDFDEKLTINKATFPDITDLPAETVTKCSEETVQLTPALGGAIVGAVSWSYSSSAPGVATVSDAGLVTAVGAGDATITVTASATGYTSKDAIVTVHVNAAPSLILTGTSPKGTDEAATYPWEYMTITATCSVTPTWDLTGKPAGFTEDVDYVVEGSDKVYKIKAKQTNNEDTDKFTFTVTATADNGCSTVVPFDVYINAAPAEDCGD